MVHAYNPISQEMEVGALEVQGYSLACEMSGRLVSVTRQDPV